MVCLICGDTIIVKQLGTWREVDVRTPAGRIGRVLPDQKGDNHVHLRFKREGDEVWYPCLLRRLDGSFFCKCSPRDHEDRVADYIAQQKRRLRSWKEWS